MPFSELPAGEHDPLFQLSMMGLVAKELGMVAMMWEFQDQRLYFSGDPLTLGWLRPCMTLAEFHAAVHPGDMPLLEACLARCLATAAETGSQQLRLASGSLSWQTLECRFRLSECDEAGQPARLVGMLMPAVPGKMQQTAVLQ